MINDHSSHPCRLEILKLYEQRKQELDYNKIQELDQKIAVKLKEWNKINQHPQATKPIESEETEIEN